MVVIDYLRLLRAAFLVGSLLSTAALAQAKEMRGRVVAIADGDTLTVLDSSDK